MPLPTPDTRKAILKILQPITRHTLHTTLYILTLLLIACTTTAERTWQRIQDTGVLQVGLDPTYPPFETAEGGELRGIDVDLARAIGGELGLAVEFVYFGYDGLYDALATEQVDVLISALVVRPDQTRDFAYGETYFNAGQVLVVPRSDNSIVAMQDLAGHALAVELGAQGHVEATQWQRRLRELIIEPFPTPHEALDALAQNTVDAALVDAISARIYLDGRDDLKLLNPPVTVEPFAMVVRKEDEQLLRELNAALETIEESGQLQTIIERWMSAQ